MHCCGNLGKEFMVKQSYEEIIEECVKIKMSNVPVRMAGADLTWLDVEINKMKKRLLERLESNHG